MSRSQKHKSNLHSRSSKAAPGSRTPRAGQGSSSIASEISTLEFGVRKSIRYHIKREAFFSKLYVLSVTASIVISGSAFGTLLKGYEGVALWLMALIFLLSVLDLVIGFSKKVVQYRALQHRFSDLLNKIINGNKTKQNLKKWQTERNNIEKEEPPSLSVLNVFCHNEEAIAQGKSHAVYHLSRWRVFLCHFLSFDSYNPELKSKKHQ